MSASGQQYALKLRLRDGRIAPVAVVRRTTIEPPELTQSCPLGRVATSIEPPHCPVLFVLKP